MTNIEQKIEASLNDLYEIDPALKQYETKLKEIIREVLLAKPDTKFSQAFAHDLRRKLIAQADLQNEKANRPVFNGFKNFAKLSIAIPALAVIALVMAAGTYYNRAAKVAVPGEVQLFAEAPKINSVGANAFGKLSADQTQPQPEVSQQSGSQPQASAPSGGSQTSAPTMLGRGGGMGGGVGIMPPIEQFAYVYNGAEFPLDEKQMNVYRRNKTALPQSAASTLISRLNFGLFNLGSFSNISMQSMSLAEDKDYGYQIQVNFQDGTISIFENWQRWPAGQKEVSKLELSDVPADKNLIAMSNQFLKDHNISTANYGEPFVDASWKAAYDQTPNKAEFYLPDVMAVVYPMKINGMDVYDESGNKTGMSVNVNIREKRVSGISELSAQDYDRSLYDTETNRGALIKFAESGGYHNVIYYAMGVNGGRKTTKVELGTPSLAYMKVWKYEPNQNQSGELLVPTLVFPITNANGANTYRKNIMVPLVKDLLK